MKPLFFFLLLFYGLSAFSQSEEIFKPCGTDQMQQVLFDRFPMFHNNMNQAQEQLEQHTLNYTKFKKQSVDSDSVFIIPVVVHIIHDYGTENIDDAQVENAISVLNTDYRNMDTDTSLIRQEFRHLVADCSIEFRLAQLDPYGKCTKGINRIADTLTYVGDHSVKALMQWPPDMYLNIWVVDNAGGLAGHALFPSSVDTIPSWDGIVIQHDYFGSTGTSSETKSLVLTHEVGHYLNLQHTWGGNNAPNLPYWAPGDTANCGYDDGVDDTPNTVGWQTCNTAGVSCGTLNNVQNYMEYAYCTTRMFTEGQKQRMRACLTSSVANRNKLWSAQNLAATGVDSTAILCTADFETERTVICEGQSLTFSDKSFHGVSFWQWTFPGASPATSTDQNPVVTYSSPGIYDVTLTVGNGIQTIDSTKQGYIIVLPTSTYLPPYLETFDTVSALENEWTVINTDHANGWVLTNQASYSGTQSVMIDNYSNTFEGRFDELISNTVDLSGFTEVVLSFRYAYAQRLNTNNDKLKIYVSKDCGENWSLKASLSGASLATVDSSLVAFFPTSHGEWGYEEVTNISSSYLVSDFRLKFSFESDRGNNIFLDDIYVNDVAMGIESIRESNQIRIIPNPVEKDLQLFLPSDKINKIELVDIRGKNISSIIPLTDKVQTIATDFLSPGMYLIQIVSSKGMYVERFVKN